VKQAGNEPFPVYTARCQAGTVISYQLPPSG